MTASEAALWHVTPRIKVGECKCSSRGCFFAMLSRRQEARRINTECDFDWKLTAPPYQCRWTSYVWPFNNSYASLLKSQWARLIATQLKGGDKLAFTDSHLLNLDSILVEARNSSGRVFFRVRPLSVSSSHFNLRCSHKLGVYMSALWPWGSCGRFNLGHSGCLKGR